MSNTKLFYELNKEGDVVWEYDLRPPYEEGRRVVEATQPKGMIKPRWMGDDASGHWVDMAPRTEHEARIDAQTDEEIRTWALKKGKNEAYYINCGIRLSLSSAPPDSTSADYRHYHEYAAQVEVLKKEGKAKKAALS